MKKSEALWNALIESFIPKDKFPDKFPEMIISGNFDLESATLDSNECYSL